MIQEPSRQKLTLPEWITTCFILLECAGHKNVHESGCPKQVRRRIIRKPVHKARTKIGIEEFITLSRKELMNWTILTLPVGDVIQRATRCTLLVVVFEA